MSLLPSQQTALDIADGRGSVLAVARDVLLRGGLIAGGLYLAGERDTGKLIRGGLAASLTIETFVLAWTCFAPRPTPAEPSTPEIPPGSMVAGRYAWALPQRALGVDHG